MNNSIINKFLTVCFFLFCGAFLWAQESAASGAEEAISAGAEPPAGSAADNTETAAVPDAAPAGWETDETETAAVGDDEPAGWETDDTGTAAAPDETPAGWETNDAETAAVDEGEAASDVSPASEDEQVISEKKPFRMKNRGFELSLVNLDLNITNDYFTTKDFFGMGLFGTLINSWNIIQNPKKYMGDKLRFNLNDILERGFKVDFDVDVAPLLAFNFNRQDKWGFGLDIAKVSASGNISLSKNLLSFTETDSDTFGVGGAVFFDIGIPVFFHVNEFKVKFRPAAYSTLLYTEPGVSYSFKNVTNPVTGNPGQRMEVAWEMDVYSAVNLRDVLEGSFNISDVDFWDIPRNFGYDFGLGVEYPLFPWLDIGTDLKNVPIPFAGSRLHHYVSLKDSAYIDTSYITIADLLNGNEIPEDAIHFPEEFEITDEDYGYNSKGIKLYRPFTWMFYAVYRPFYSPILSLLPSLGFSINRLYPNIGSIEGGLSVRLDLANMFALTAGINYNDRLWKNSLALMLFNFRAIEIDIGISSESPRFVKSWQGAGLGFQFALKLGW